jgi:hypothetical protein
MSNFERYSIFFKIQKVGSATVPTQTGGRGRPSYNSHHGFMMKQDARLIMGQVTLFFHAFLPERAF